jgi:D-threo-aldose 1-dehydrogenase
MSLSTPETDTFPRRPFGAGGEQVTVIGLGGACLDRHGLETGVATVRRALDVGVAYFDTAPAYGRGASQVILGNALEGVKQPYVLATKLGYLATPAAFRSPEALRAQLWENLRALRRPSVDLLQVHLAELACWWQDGADPDQRIDPGSPYDFSQAPVVEVLNEARRQGVCRYTGITADDADGLAQVSRHVSVDSCLSAYDYTLLSRRARRALLPLVRQQGRAYIAAGVLKSVGADVRRSDHAGLADIQRACGLSLAALAVRYLLNEPDITLILVGAATPEEIEECATAAQQGPLPEEVHREIEVLGRE